MLAPQSEANVCQHKCNLRNSRLLFAQDTQQKLGVEFSYLERITDLGLFQTSCYCRAKLARLQHDTSTTWFQTSNLIQSNRTAVAENKTQK